MKDFDPARRTFLQSTGSLAAGAWLTANLPAVAAVAREASDAFAGKAGFKVLSMTEATTLDAIAAQIIPSDDTPGAREAGVIYFIDRALASFMSGSLEFVRTEIGKFDVGVSASYAGKEHFVSLDDDEQIAYLKLNESSGFFGFLQFLTKMGMFCLPTYGGNRDHVGWQLIGFDHRHAWAPPFGHYDAEYAAADKAKDYD